MTAKTRARFCQGIDMGRMDVVGSEALQFWAQIIHANQQHVSLFRRLVFQASPIEVRSAAARQTGEMLHHQGCHQG